MEAEAANLLVFDGELVVVRYFRVLGNRDLRVNDDFLLAIGPGNHFGNAVRHTAVVDETS